MTVTSAASSGQPPKSPASLLQVAPAGEPGTRLTVSGVVRDRAGQPIAGAQLHVYQTDAGGHYTPNKPMDEPHARLSGRLRTGADGRFELRTIRPGGYPWTVRLKGRRRKIPAHIHIDVTAPGLAMRRFQVVFADDPLLADPYWKAWIKRLRQPVLEAAAHEGGLAGTVILVVP